MSVSTSGTISQIKKKTHELLENLATLHSEFDIAGDFYIMLDKCTAETITFDDNLTSFD